MLSGSFSFLLPFISCFKNNPEARPNQLRGYDMLFYNESTELEDCREIEVLELEVVSGAGSE
jgi:hypothetical protein